jgi:hypothetical protein
MITTTSTEFVKNFGQYSEEAQREPVAVTNYGRVNGYFISAREFETLQKIKAEMRQSYTIKTLPDEDFKRLMTTEMDPRHDHLNALMED